MSVLTTENNWSANYPSCNWRKPYDWDRRVQTATLSCAEGMVELYISFDATEGADEKVQEFSMDTIVAGRRHSVWQTRTRRDWITTRGARIIARRWLRGLQA